MPGDDPSVFDPPDPDRVYRNHLETCRHLGVEPVPRERARKLIQEWTDTIAPSRSVPPITRV